MAAGERRRRLLRLLLLLAATCGRGAGGEVTRCQGPSTLLDLSGCRLLGCAGDVVLTAGPAPPGLCAHLRLQAQGVQAAALAAAGAQAALSASQRPSESPMGQAAAAAVARMGAGAAQRAPGLSIRLSAAEDDVKDANQDIQDAEQYLKPARGARFSFGGLGNEMKDKGKQKGKEAASNALSGALSSFRTHLPSFPDAPGGANQYAGDARQQLRQRSREQEKTDFFNNLRLACATLDAMEAEDRRKAVNSFGSARFSFGSLKDTMKDKIKNAGTEAASGALKGALRGFRRSESDKVWSAVSGYFGGPEEEKKCEVQKEEGINSIISDLKDSLLGGGQKESDTASMSEAVKGLLSSARSIPLDSLGSSLGSLTEPKPESIDGIIGDALKKLAAAKALMKAKQLQEELG